MISFTLKGKNFDPRASYWCPNVWYREGQEARWIAPVNVPGPIPITQNTVQFQNIPSNAGFAAGFYTSPRIEDIIGGTFAFAATDIFVLHDKATYVLDFHSEIGVPTLEEETVTPPEEFPSWTKILVALLPWGPLEGPPLPMGFFPPWPLSIGNWMNIPGYPKILP